MSCGSPPSTMVSPLFTACPSCTVTCLSLAIRSVVGHPVEVGDHQPLLALGVLAERTMPVTSASIPASFGVQRVIGIQQCDQHVDVEQCLHQAAASSRRASIIALVTMPPDSETDGSHGRPRVRGPRSPRASHSVCAAPGPTRSHRSFCAPAAPVPGRTQDVVGDVERSAHASDANDRSTCLTAALSRSRLSAALASELSEYVRTIASCNLTRASLAGS